MARLDLLHGKMLEVVHGTLNGLATMLRTRGWRKLSGLPPRIVKLDEGAAQTGRLLVERSSFRHRRYSAKGRELCIASVATACLTSPERAPASVASTRNPLKRKHYIDRQRLQRFYLGFSAGGELTGKGQGTVCESPDVRARAP
jgi:hypothetical protein